MMKEDVSQALHKLGKRLSRSDNMRRASVKWEGS